MEHKAISLRPFIGAKDFELSRIFYRHMGFEEKVLFHNMSLFTNNAIGFYLQDAYVKDWIDNTMVFMEVADLDKFWNELLALDLPSKFKEVKLVPIREHDWGREFFLHDPCGILWHMGAFRKK